MRCIIVLAILCSFIVPTQAYAQKRIALVIGNSSYQKSPLKNPVNDANAMAAQLKKSGFEVIKKTNLTRKQMRSAIRDYGDKLKRADAGLFYYAGHGAQVEGENYLIPLGAEIEREDEISDEAVGLNALLRKITSASNAFNMIILDACRDNPFGQAFSRSSSRGLARVNAPSGTVVIYAAAPGQTSSDGHGNNGLFTEHFLAQMKTPGLELGELLRNTGRAVYRDSRQKQEPFVERSLLAGAFYFNQTTTIASINSSSNQQYMGNLSPAELSAWQGVRQCTDINKVRSFINDFPNGTFTPVAKNCLEKLKANQLLPFYIDTQPSNAQVRVLNINPKYQYGMKLKPQRYQVEVSQNGYQTKTQWFELNKAKQSLYLELEKENDNKVYEVVVKVTTTTMEATYQNTDNAGPEISFQSTAYSDTNTHTETLLLNKGNYTFRLKYRSNRKIKYYTVSVFVCGGGVITLSPLAFQKLTYSESCSDDTSRYLVNSTESSIAGQDKTYTVNGVSFTMKAIPAGSFEMGCVSGLECQGDEFPIHTVTLPAFDMMETETTFALWDACVDDNGCSHQPRDEGWGRGNRPVMNVSFDDITKEFIPWLNQKLEIQTNQKFSLPSEAQWEYAARAGTTTKYSWGDFINCSMARYGYTSTECDKQKGSDPVKLFSPNDFGLFDMHGNVREWTQDCWNNSYKGASINGEAWLSGDCDKRVMRGGSWSVLFPYYLRSAERFTDNRNERSYGLGFRIVQSVR